MLRFIDNTERTDAELVKPWPDQHGQWQVIFECRSQDGTRQLDYCREQPPLQVDEEGDMRAMTRAEVATWAKNTVCAHRALNACRIDWF